MFEKTNKLDNVSSAKNYKLEREEYMMNARSVRVSLAIFLVGMSSVGSAQVLQYVGCEVENANEFAAMIDRVHSAMSEGDRPTVTLLQNSFNGPSTQTHTVLLEFPDYESLQAWGGRIAQSPAVQLNFERSSHNQECNTQGIVVERASWGDRDADWGYNAVFPVTTSDADAYVAALGDLFTSETGENMPGATILYESRAGGANTHVVVALAPDFAALNNYLDTFYQSDEFEDFSDEVSEIRSVGVRTQSRRVRTWEP